MDPDTELRCRNYLGGSCVHASMITILNWQHKYKEAKHWRRFYSGAEGKGALIYKANKLNLDIAYTLNGSRKFLEWCSRTRRGAVIFYFDNHCVTFCGYKKINNKMVAILIDNNNVSHNIMIPKSEFLANWNSEFALTLVHSPTPPRPKLK